MNETIELGLPSQIHDSSACNDPESRMGADTGGLLFVIASFQFTIGIADVEAVRMVVNGLGEWGYVEPITAL